jgi:hypothetical protein
MSEKSCWGRLIVALDPVSSNDDWRRQVDDPAAVMHSNDVLHTVADEPSCRCTRRVSKSVVGFSIAGVLEESKDWWCGAFDEHLAVGRSVSIAVACFRLGYWSRKHDSDVSGRDPSSLAEFCPMSLLFLYGPDVNVEAQVRWRYASGCVRSEYHDPGFRKHNENRQTYFAFVFDLKKNGGRCVTDQGHR